MSAKEPWESSAQRRRPSTNNSCACFAEDLDMLFVEFSTDNVYRTPVRDLQSLKARIKSAIESVTLDMLQNTWKDCDQRLDVLRATKGAHVEVT